MNKQITYRILIDIILAILILNGYWFLALPVALIGLWFSPYFIEIIIAGIAYDALFGMTVGSGWRGYVGTILALVIVCIVYFGKRVVR